MAEKCEDNRDLTFNRVYEMLYKEKELTITQNYIGDVGCVVWDAAIVLARFLEHKYFPAHYWVGKRVLELGSGAGLVGLVAGCLGADVILTDLEEIVPLLNVNIKLNKVLIEGTAVGKTLKWGGASGFDMPDVILMSDLVYYSEALDPLCYTLTELTDKNSLVLLSYEERDTGNKKELEEVFFNFLKKRFEISEIPTNTLDEIYRSEDIHVFTLKCH
ncbi:Protein-lysine methyltransferase METTL21D-like [Oopsacas minuta]|uniref:Protein-lysine methyltransferase METTL21D-like n=1 Tax=Oopsacas minuta TaxID=111878 RepID=A0AAV7JBM7_9METZ|nr:Protein-lysine methyltransferase METTL21D-like [Oopsacas minuta]